MQLNFEGDSDTDMVHWMKVSGTKRYTYTWRIYVAGECRVEKFQGNMAWHVVNSKGISKGNSDDGGPCQIETRTPLDIPDGYSQCMLELLVKDVDYHGASKDEEDHICFKGIDRHG